jgi:hypothetical protein
MRERVKKYLSVIISLLLVLSVFGGELSARDAQAKTVNRVFIMHRVMVLRFTIIRELIITQNSI